MIRGLSAAEVRLSTRASHTILFTSVGVYFQLNKPVLFVIIRKGNPDVLFTPIDKVYFSCFSNMFVSNLPELFLLFSSVFIYN